jgi:rhamnogalacturonyl hydrolase YesR
MMLLAMTETVVLAVDAAPTSAHVYAVTEKVAHWQIDTFAEHYKYRHHTIKEENGPNWHDLAWHNGALYAGLNEWRKLTKDPKVSDFLLLIGTRNQWKILTEKPYNADDHTVGQLYLSLYDETKDEVMIKHLRDHFDWILANPRTGSITWDDKGKFRARWGWSDALFMAPPVWARLAKVTGESKYLEFMDHEFRFSAHILWNEKHHLFSRDTRFFTQQEANGQPVFWARGNGWVFGGLAMMIPDLPKNWPNRLFYIETFTKMAETIRATQRSDGTWSMGMLGSEADYPTKETSGTSFMTFGLAWGINNGLLERSIYEPIVLKSWRALEACVTPEGFLGYVQGVGAGPGEAQPDKTEVYGTGAFVAAGTEMVRFLRSSETKP